jgi:predicted amidohydrolase YtcJ
VTRLALAFTAALAAALPACAPVYRPAADMVLIHARVWTVDDKLPEAQALAVVGDRVVAVGSDAEITAWRGPETRVIDALGRRVLPGFNDVHAHIVPGGQEIDGADLRHATSPEDFKRRLAARAQGVPRGQWITAGTWNEQQWAPAELPTRELIDPVTPDTPVLLSRVDGHAALANSAALKLAGITNTTPDLPGGVIVRDAHGAPTGLLKDTAVERVLKVIPPLKREQRMEIARRALALAASLGLTSLQNMDADDGEGYGDLSVFAELAERGELTARVYDALPILQWEDQARLGLRRGFGSPMLRVGAVKGFADGSVGTHSAFFFDPYDDAPESRGALGHMMTPLDAMTKRLTQADAAGLQLCVHAIGDHANATMLDLYEKVVAANGPRDRRLRMEHAQHVRPQDFDRFAKLGVVVTVQPSVPSWFEKRIGKTRLATTAALRAFLDHKVHVAIGTDWPVASLNPLETLSEAVIPMDKAHPEGVVPGQAISVREAVAAYTLGSAYAEFQDDQKGTLTPGKLADFVILDDDILTIPADRIRAVKVDVTIVGGRVVFDRKKGG